MADNTWRVDTPTCSPPATRHGLSRDGCDKVMFSQPGILDPICVGWRMASHEACAYLGCVVGVPLGTGWHPRARPELEPVHADVFDQA